MPRRDAGLTLVELMVAMSIFLVAMVMFGTSLYVVQRLQSTNSQYSRANDQANLALQAIDRQVRSGYVIAMPVAPAGTDAAVKIYTEAGGKPRCVMWAVAPPAVTDPTVTAGTKWLYTTAWDPTGVDPQLPSSLPAFVGNGQRWATAATDLWNWLVVGDPVVPFAIPLAPSNVLKTLDVSLVLNASTRPEAAIELRSTFTSRNVPRDKEAVSGLGTTKGATC